MNFVNLKDYAVLGYEVLVDGEVTESGKITDEALLELAAGCEKTIPLAISVPEQGKCGAEGYLVSETGHWRCCRSSSNWDLKKFR